MRIIEFGPTTAHPMDRFQSHEAVFSRLAETSGPGRVGCMRLGPRGTVGRHPAARDQLFCVVEGEGEVSGADGLRASIQAGQAALWVAGEVHETTTETGLTAIIFEVEAVNH